MVSSQSKAGLLGAAQVVKLALAAGKAVLSEKPAGPTLVAVQELLRWRSLLPGPRACWCVAENYR